MSHGIRIDPSTDHEDIREKTDGYLDGEPVQIKLRRSKRAGRNDLAYELCRNHRRNDSLLDQINCPRQFGRDRASGVKHYFVMNAEETAIYHCSSNSIHILVDHAVAEMQVVVGPCLSRAYRSTFGVDLRPTRDPDPDSFTPQKVMAFLPIERIAIKRYEVISG